MTIGAGELLQVNGMGEDYLAYVLIVKGDFTGGMAGGAIALDAESR
jgi:hypothetical protein